MTAIGHNNDRYRNALAKLDNLIAGRTSHINQRPQSNGSTNLAVKRHELQASLSELKAERAKALAERKAAKLAMQAERFAVSGGIDPSTGKPFRGSGIGTASTMTRNACALAVRFEKIGDTDTAGLLREWAAYGREIMDRLIADQNETIAKARQAGLIDAHGRGAPVPLEKVIAANDK